MADLSGQTIGRYHIIEKLGEGGMATVYKAYDNQLGRDVAVKILRKDAFPENMYDRILKRFMREAKALAKLSDLHIVKILDYGDYEGSPFLVMEYLSGGTLKDMTGTPMPPLEAARLLVPVARALANAHRHNIIHRDVKPGNILITAKGDLMLSDFGIAKVLDMEDGNTLTGVNMGVGTPEYMAPEQWQNRITPAADIYALGVVLFELVTGKKPYIADTPAAVLLKQAMDPIPQPSMIIFGLSDDVEKVILRAMAKQPDERFSSMNEFSEALEKLSVQNPQQINLPTKNIKSKGEMENPTRKKDLTGLIFWKLEQSQPGETQKKAEKRWVSIGLTCCAMLGIIIGSVWLSGRIDTPQITKTSVVLNVSPTKMTTPSPINTLVPVIIIPSSTPQPLPTATQTLGIGSNQISEVDGMELLYVPEGTFLMGSDLKKDPAANADELPQHNVNLKAFWIDKTEITNSMYALCVAAGVCIKPDVSDYSNADKKDFPVLVYEWKNAQKYCQWAGRRLLTEAEWEKAARGTDGRLYPMGNELLGIRSGIFAVGTLPIDSSPYGALDLSGNVSEWVQDWYSSTFYRKSSEYYPKGPDSGTQHVMRGGSSSSSENMSRSANRNPVHTYKISAGAGCVIQRDPIYVCVPIATKEKHIDVGIRCGMDGE